MPPELDNQDPELDAQDMGADEPAMDEPAMDAPAMDEPTDGNVIGLHGDETDREGAMAKADLFKLANYSHKLYQQLNDEDQMESWVQAKITKAADYIASVYHYLEYEMKFSEYGHHLDNSDTLSEGQKKILKARLTEAKMRIRELKTAQAEKIKLAEGVMNGGEHSCDACGGTGVVHKPGVQPSDRAKKLAAAHNRETRAHYAAHKRLQAEEEGVEEGFGETEPKEMKVGDTKKTRTGELTKTSTGVVHKNTSYHDDGEAEEKSGKGVKSHAKAQSAAEKKDRAPAQKQSPKSAKTWGMKDNEKFDNRDKVDEAKSKMAKKDYDKDGKVESGKDEYLGSKIRAAKKAGKLKEAQKCTECGMFESKCKCSIEEGAKPSAGLSKAKKSSVVKDAKAGKDIGKPGKSFDKVAKSAGGGKKGEKIAAAAMWKNIKETQAYLAEKKKKEKMTDENLVPVPNPSGAKDAEEAKKLGAMMPKPAGSAKDPISESARLRQLTDRLNQSEKPALIENREVDQIRALTKRLLG
jgi:hypothetical protein